MNSRRTFLRHAILGTTALSLPNFKAYSMDFIFKASQPGYPKISLAQWSLHKAFFSEELDPIDFASIANNTFGIHAIEYVSAFYEKQASNEKFWNDMKQTAHNEGVENLLIMVDSEGDLGDANSTKRKKAVENHYKWVHAAKIMGCHSIRVNAFGNGDRDSLKTNLKDGLGNLASYGAQEGIHILVENHGLHTSDGAFMVDIIKAVNNSHLGTLPDFGNWCLNKEWGGTQNNSCSKSYDSLKGLTDFLPFAQGVSAKSYDFAADGTQLDLDYYQLLKIVKDAGYTGHIGIEYEGEKLSETEGIKATKRLIENVWEAL